MHHNKSAVLTVSSARVYAQAVRRNRRALSYAVAIIQSLTAGTSAAAQQRRVQLASHRAFCCQLMQASMWIMIAF